MTELEMESEPSPVPLSFWQWLRRNLWPSNVELHQQLQKRMQGLDDAIAMNPEAASNYVLRGEIYLRLEEFSLARLDFERAVDRIAEQIENDRWGIVAQSLQDRAQRGLETAIRMLARLPDRSLESGVQQEETLTTDDNEAWGAADQMVESDNQADFETDF